jgi:hypothetical protein
MCVTIIKIKVCVNHFVEETVIFFCVNCCVKETQINFVVLTVSLIETK